MKKNMTNVIAMALTTAMAFAGVTACGSSSTTTTAAATEAATTAAATTAAAADTAADTTAATTTAAAEPAGDVSGELHAAGSSALQPLAQAAADLFMDKYPDANVFVDGGGSGTGLKQVAADAIDIGNSDVYAEEKLDADQAKDLVDHQVCTITMAPVVKKDLGVPNLPTEQLTDIFTAKTTNWKDVGGPDEEILLVTRPATSGTRATFKTWALNGAEEASNESLETDDSGTLLQTVQDNKGAIGYVALSYLVNNDAVQAVSIDGVEPSLENTYNGTYKVWAYEHMYTKGDGSDIAQVFITVILSHFLIQDEVVFIQAIRILGTGWTVILLFSAIKSVHQYSFGKTVFAIVLTIAAMLVMLFLLVLFMSLVQQVYIFLSTIYTEISYRIRV